MRVAEAIELCVRVVITGAAVPACDSCAGAELDHTEGDDRAGECVAMSAGADERVDIPRQIALRGHARRENKKAQENYDAHILSVCFTGLSGFSRLNPVNHANHA